MRIIEICVDHCTCTGSCGQSVRDHSWKQWFAFDRAIDDPTATLRELANATFDVFHLGHFGLIGQDRFRGTLYELAIDIGRVLRIIRVHWLGDAHRASGHERYASCCGG